jgi:hypothetical protein
MSTGTSRKKDLKKKARPSGGFSRRDMLLTGTSILAVSGLEPASPFAAAQAQPAKPAAQPKPAACARAVRAAANILVIMGDDIGQSNVSAYTFGLMGYKTPNIDRIAQEGTIFTDYYAEQSCTAGRSSFLTGQATLRAGLSKTPIIPRTRPSRQSSGREACSKPRLRRPMMRRRTRVLAASASRLSKIQVP